jgi:hypothetical protein
MIKSEEQLNQTRLAINKLESGLAALKHEVLPRNPARFSLMAEPVVDQIRELRAQIEEYIGVTRATAEEADIWMRIQGPEIELGDAPTSVVTAMLDLLRRGVQTVAELLQKGSVGARPTAEIKQACDLRIVGWQSGSVKVGLRLPIASSSHLFEETDIAHQARQALRLYLQTASWVGSEHDATRFESEIPDAEQRRLLLNQVARLVPRPRGGVEIIELSGKEIAQKSVCLQRASRERIRQAISRTVEDEMVNAEGILREIDLDQRTFIIRELDAGKETRCAIMPQDDDLLDIAKDALDHRVAVSGTRRKDPVRRQVYPLQIREIEVLGQAADESLELPVV